MACERDELGLSLSLNLPETLTDRNTLSMHLKLVPTIGTSLVNHPFNPFAKLLYNQPLISSSDRNSVEARSLLRSIDMNLLPPAVCDDEFVVSSPNSTISSVSGKRYERETNTEDLEMERACSRGMSDEDEDLEASRKKLRLSKDQSAILEQTFKDHNTLNPKQKLALAKRLNLRPRQVEVWFQNRRARTKLKQTEVDCEFLKRCCENLTEENRRLQKEVQELRAIKLSPQLYMQMNPPTTLTMCPSCERVAGPTQSAQAQYRHTKPMNPWSSTTPIPHRPLDALRLRS